MTVEVLCPHCGAAYQIAFEKIVYASLDDST